MFKIYRLYLATNFILPFIVSTTFFVTFLMVFEMFRIMQLLSARDIGLDFVFVLMGNISVTLLPMALPLAIFFSTIFCLNKLSGDSEYIALRAMGISKKNLLAPFIVVATIISINIFILNREVIPDSYYEVRSMIKKISSESLIEGIKSGQFFTRIPNLTLFSSEVSQEKSLKDVYLNVYDDSDKVEKVIMANRGKILYEKNERTGIEKFKLFLQDGNILNRYLNEQKTEKISFQEYLFPISEKKFSYRMKTKEVMMNQSELESFIKDGLESALSRNYKKNEYFNARYEYFNRINTPLLCIVLTFLGFGLGVKGNRGRGKNKSATAIQYLIGYYVLYFGLISVSRDGSIPLYIAVFFPMIFLIGLSIYSYKKVDWVS